jgi:hypothetical protein
VRINVNWSQFKKAIKVLKRMLDDSSTYLAGERDRWSSGGAVEENA